MADILRLLPDVANILWPLIIISMLIFWRKELKKAVAGGSEIAVEVFGAKIVLKPGSSAKTGQQQLPAVAQGEKLPHDYFYLNHTSFLLEHRQEQYVEQTGLPAPLFNIHVTVESYYEGALDRVARVEYVLHESYKEHIRVRTDPEDNFILKELAYGEYVLTALVSLKDRKEPIVLSRYITLWESGPSIDPTAAV